MADYLPHTEEDVAAMLAFLGLADLDELFAAVPQALRLAGGLELAPGEPEPDVLDHMGALARANRAGDLVCFAGAGAYDHEIPPVVRALAGRSEFVTAYTPYQPEVAQGVLQAVFEYQTMVARLAGLPVANASLYDGASALVEAVNLGTAASGRQAVWVSAGVHPHWRRCLRTFARGSGHEIVEIPLADGVTAWPGDADSAAGDGPGAIVVAYPNYLGCLEDLAAVRRMADARAATMVVAADPVAAGILQSAGSVGADVVVGEGQPFGTALSFGGPYLGLFCCTMAQVRRLPGRLVGETVDVEGRRAYVTTLRAREQDIRREKATSNVCTNQTLMAVTAAVQLGWLGTRGLEEVALRCARGTRYLRDAALGIDGISPVTGNTPVVRELALRTAVPARTVVDRMTSEGFLAGVALSDLVGGDGDRSVDADAAEHGLLVAVTERRTLAEMNGYLVALDKAVRP
ncbi:MAG TPA: aminomethyl-transferring glycine dehydrogenase subunit GcvPA [Acidimicrobiales bacterium]|nr:aminomethyl-transferring glycine dehydrogenase subunit GcvPA [Acidimicrobiales bacterium]